MLPNSADCTPGSSVACDQLFAVGESILQVAFDAVNNEGAYVNECDHPNVDGMVVVGRADGYPQTDIIIVSMARLTPRLNAASTTSRPTAPLSFDSVWNVRLVETGWVTFEDGGDEEVIIPDPGFITALALHSYGHAEQMYRALANAVSIGTLANCAKGRCQATIRELAPVDPMGHTVGWETIVQVPIDLSQPCTATS